MALGDILIFANTQMQAQRVARDLSLGSNWTHVDRHEKVAGLDFAGKIAYVCENIRDDNIFYRVQPRLLSSGARIRWI